MTAFGKPLNTIYRFDRADVIVSLDADFLCSTVPGSLRYCRDYSAPPARGCRKSEGCASAALYCRECAFSDR